MPATTPLEFWPRWSDSIGVEVWAKRDDISAIGLGGNKIRKLDLILGAAKAAGVDSLVTTGAVQSNHCRLTAAAAARLGMACTVILRGKRPRVPAGNLLLDLMFGARVVFTDDPEDYAAADRLMGLESERHKADGRVPLIIPLGASNDLGTIAYALAVDELAHQWIGPAPRSFVVSVGSGATCAGISLGASIWLPDVHVLGVSSGWSRLRVSKAISALHAAAAPLVGVAGAKQKLEIDVEHIGSGYGRATPGGIAAVRGLARTEGVLADLTYVGKALDSLTDRARQGALPGPVVFWHTGGAPEIFARRPAELLT